MIRSEEARAVLVEDLPGVMRKLANVVIQEQLLSAIVDQPRSVTELAEATGHEAGTITRYTRELERLKMVTRTARPPRVICALNRDVVAIDRQGRVCVTFRTAGGATMTLQLEIYARDHRYRRRRGESNTRFAAETDGPRRQVHPVLRVRASNHRSS